jgi:predicted Zn-dependent protease
MRSSLRLLGFVLALVVPAAGAAHEPNRNEEAEIVRSITAACPGSRALAERAASSFHDRAGRAAALAAYQELARCPKAPAIVHVRVGFLKLEAGDFAGAEASCRRAVALDPSMTNRLSLLEALVRQRKPEADALYAELMRYDGDRDDVWAGLAYAAFHRDDVEGMRRASARAIALGTKWWQPWFTAAVAEGLAPRPDTARALGWLDRADALGAPRRYTDEIRSGLRDAAARDEAHPPR